MLTLIEAPKVYLNNAGSGILSIAATNAATGMPETFDVKKNEVWFVDVSYEVANPTITVEHTGPDGAFTALTKAHDGTNIFGTQGFWIQFTKAAKGVQLTARFSTGVGFAALWLQRRMANGTVTMTNEGTSTSGSTTTITVPSVTGSTFHKASLKLFGSVTFVQANTQYCQPYGDPDNVSRAHHILFSETPFSGTLTPSTGTVSSAQAWVCTAASFADAGSPVADTNVPSWLRTARGGTVVQVPGASLFSSGLSTQNGSLISTPNVFTDYSGACMVQGGLYVGTEQRPGAFLYVDGGGHNTCQSNEVFAFGSLQSEAPGWARLRDNTLPVPVDVEFDGNGNPSSSHGYANRVWDTTGGTNRVLKIGSKARHNDAADITTAFAFNLNQSAPNINSPWVSEGVTTNGWWWAVWDSGTAKYWGVHQSSATLVSSYDPSTKVYSNAYGTKGGNWVQATPPIAASDQTRGIILAITGGNTFEGFRPSLASTTDFYTMSTTGTAPTTASGVVWDPVDDRFVVFCSSNPNTLFFLTPPASSPYDGGSAWTWSSLTFPGASVDTVQANGTYGRFALVNTGLIRGYLVVNSYTSAAYFFVPPSATLGRPPVDSVDTTSHPISTLRLRSQGLQ